MDRISFTGINNLYIGRRAYKSFGSYMDVTGRIYQGNKDFSEMLIKCDLTNDENGKHLKEFVEALDKCVPHYRVNCVNPEKPNSIRLFLRHIIPEDMDYLSFSNFKINDCEILLNNCEALPLFTYMAKLTRQIQGLPDVSPAQKKCAATFNKCVHNTACEFIDNMC